MSVLYRVEVKTRLHVFLTLGAQGCAEPASRCGSLSPVSAGSGFLCAPETVPMLWTKDMQEVEPPSSANPSEWSPCSVSSLDSHI